jgi:LacI family transcriptional regulator
MIKKRITISDIAHEAGVSKSTVSRILNGNIPVNQDKVDAVEAAIARLNYRPSSLARSLRTQKTQTVGLLINDIMNPFYSALARGIEEEAILAGYSLILCNTNEDSKRELRYLRTLQDKHVDGVILGPVGDNVDYIANLSRHIPLIQVDRHINCDDIASVTVDNEQGAYQATRLLLDKGHRRIAVFTWEQEIATMSQRLAGYQRAMGEAGLKPDPSDIVRVPRVTQQDAAQIALEYLQTNTSCTAIFAFNNQLGLGVLIGSRRLNLNIPQDIALVVFDDLAAFQVTDPPITVVNQPAYEVGQEAMRQLLKLMNHDADFTPREMVIPTELIIRQSV